MSKWRRLSLQGKGKAFVSCLQKCVLWALNCWFALSELHSSVSALSHLYIGHMFMVAPLSSLPGCFVPVDLLHWIRALGEKQPCCWEISVNVNHLVSLSLMRNMATTGTLITQGQSYFRCSFWEINLNRLSAPLQVLFIKLIIVLATLRLRFSAIHSPCLSLLSSVAAFIPFTFMFSSAFMF